MSVNNPKISIIVPVYNSEKYLHRCIDSILAQTFKDFELLLIDDGSTDRSGKICDEYAAKDERISVFHKQNEGASEARNYGLSRANGVYVSFIDSDDWMEPSYYDNFFEDKDFVYDIYFQNYVLHKADGNVEMKPLRSMAIHEGSTHEALFYLMKEVKFGWSWIKLFKRSIIMEHHLLFDRSVNLREDELFALQYCRYIKSIFISAQAGYHYYIYGNSLTRRFRDPEEFVRISRLLRDESSYIQAEGAQKWIDQYYLTNLYMSVLQMYVHGACSNLDQKERYKLISDFLNFYKDHPQLDVAYKSLKSKFLYHTLWIIGSVSLIDVVMQKWFHVSYAR